MKKLVIKNFLAIDFAEIEFAQFTIIIGPQASGKSLMCKLNFFFWDLLISDQQRFIYERSSLEKFEDFIKAKFMEWFPVSAWGDKVFEIRFYCAKFEIGLTGTGAKEKSAGNMEVTFSDAFENFYNNAFDEAVKIFEKHRDDIGNLESYWTVRSLIDQSRRDILQKNNVNSQLFVPAGRSFFTSMVKAISIYEQSHTADPLIVRFGRAFASLSDESSFQFSDGDDFMTEYIEPTMIEMLGGKLISEHDHLYFETKDGRNIPLSALSSGQQELLPLMTVLRFYTRRSVHRSLIYIEEPETHLFPKSQNELMEFLISLTNRPNGLVDMIITTHSPYILSKVNNLLKAGTVASSLPVKEHAKVNAIIDQRAWLNNNQLAAYAIIDRKLTPIIDADGLIDAEYLDEISGDIADEFFSLLEIEATNG